MNEDNRAGLHIAMVGYRQTASIHSRLLAGEGSVGFRNARERSRMRIAIGITRPSLTERSGIAALMRLCCALPARCTRSRQPPAWSQASTSSWRSRLR